MTAVSCAQDKSNKEIKTEKMSKTESLGKEKKRILNDRVLVYYFHTNYRCWTCNQFEKLTKEVLNEHFQEQINKGLLELKVINIEDGANTHFVEDYKLVTKSLVLSLHKNKSEADWKNLEKIWVLVRDKEKFKSYVREGIAGYLKRI
jgi:hypothetical protein